MKKPIKYQIRAGQKNSPCELVKADANGFETILVEGTHTQCKRVLDELKEANK